MADEEQSYSDRLMWSGTVIRGAGKLLYANGELVGYLYPTTDGLNHVLDVKGDLVDVFATLEEARDFAKQHWDEDGSIAGNISPPKRQ